MAQTQRALYFESAPNGPIVVRTKDIPKLGPGEVLVKVLAAALNPVDWAIRALNMIVQKWPTVAGLDGAGVIEEIGEGVSGFSKGDRMLVLSDQVPRRS